MVQIATIIILKKSSSVGGGISGANFQPVDDKLERHAELTRDYGGSKFIDLQNCKTFACDLCEETFTIAASLEDHLVKFHKISEQKTSKNSFFTRISPTQEKGEASSSRKPPAGINTANLFGCNWPCYTA